MGKVRSTDGMRNAYIILLRKLKRKRSFRSECHGTVPPLQLVESDKTEHARRTAD
jgi:hypothetical protein